MSECDGPCEKLLEALHALPLFPLQDIVFFPGHLLPLHVFEPRYRQMTEAVLKGHGVIAVVNCDADESVRRIAGAGRVVHHERLEDGRYHILLQGIARVELEDELPMEGLLYRRARARVLEDASEEEVAIETSLTSLRRCYDSLTVVAPEIKEALGELPSRIDDPSVLADVLCGALLAEAEDRQLALEERRVSERLKTATSVIADRLLEKAPSTGDVVH